MAFDKPFHRTVRGMKPGPNSGYSGWAYIRDKEYARLPAHYTRAFLIIHGDLEKVFQYIEPSQEGLETYSYRIHELLMRTCIELEANFKAILNENIYTKSRYDITVYKKVDVTHHLSSYEVTLPIWHGAPTIWRPFGAWNQNQTLSWYQAYNLSKHDRQEAFKKANLGALLSAVTGLLVLLTSQFKTEDFSAGGDTLGFGSGYYDMEPALGSLFRIKYPDNWTEDEMYDFDWAELSKQSVRFSRFNYDQI